VLRPLEADVGAANGRFQPLSDEQIRKRKAKLGGLQQGDCDCVAAKLSRFETSQADIPTTWGISSTQILAAPLHLPPPAFPPSPPVATGHPRLFLLPPPSSRSKSSSKRVKGSAS